MEDDGPTIEIFKHGARADSGVTDDSISNWFKITLAFYIVSQVERLLYYVGQSDREAAMKTFLALVLLVGGFVVFAIRNRSLHLLEKKLATNVYG
ncbi:unnamed protein product [Hapterophycus canaliculatus]